MIVKAGNSVNNILNAVGRTNRPVTDRCTASDLEAQGTRIGVAESRGTSVVTLHDPEGHTAPRNAHT